MVLILPAVAWDSDVTRWRFANSRRQAERLPARVSRSPSAIHAGTDRHQHAPDEPLPSQRVRTRDFAQNGLPAKRPTINYFATE